MFTWDYNIWEGNQARRSDQVNEAEDEIDVLLS